MLRVFVCFREKTFSVKRELLLLLVPLCIIVIARCVYFPMRHVNGHIGTLNIDFDKIFPVRYNLIPFVRLFDVYDGWQLNIIGNIVIFIPVGIVWPLSFKKLNSLPKVCLAGFLYTLLIEISQILSYERCSDVDDMILNTAGVFIGAGIYFFVKRCSGK
ncbi:VanZ family protein [Treponema sp.]|uniref:VanZ family protein n=1 Tax=Treponema sp. TaxID=166 RepID=UPI0025F5FBD7|nr:VanZ family protein [Treponema sp.]MCR5217581.1 VanZ family protein [Treponema sp.]